MSEFLSEVNCHCESKSNFTLPRLPGFAITVCTLSEPSGLMAPPQFSHAGLWLIPLLKVFVSDAQILADRDETVLCADCSWQVD